MKHWERVLLLVVAAWICLEMFGRVGVLLTLVALAQPPPPFRVHASDHQGIGPQGPYLRCPDCAGTLVDRRDPQPVKALCPVCHGHGRVPLRTLGRPVVMVGNDEPTDYPMVR